MREGDTSPANDPVVKGREHLFERANPATPRK
jgi:hypothetical protein